MNKLLQKIKQGYISLVSNDSEAYPKAQCTSNSKTSDFTRMSVYGICSNPPAESHILLLSGQGNESNKFGFANDFLNRKKNLKEGEVALFHTKTKSYVLLSENGDVEVSTSANVNITASTIAIVGNVTVDGTIDATGEITSGTVTVTGHKHTQANDSDGDTQQPTNSPTPGT